MSQRSFIAWTYTIVLVLVFSLLLSIGFLSHVGNPITDSLYGTQDPLEDIIIIAIDDQSIQDIGRWPWDRSVFSDLLLNLQGASVIGVDVGFYEPSSNDTSFIKAVSVDNVVVALEFTSFENDDGMVIGKDPLLPIAGIGAFVNIITDGDGITAPTIQIFLQSMNHLL